MYLAICDEFEEEASNNGAKALGDPIEDTSKDGDVASNSQSKCDSWIQMATGDVGCNGHPHKKCEGMGHGHRYKSRGVQGCIRCELIYIYKSKIIINSHRKQNF